MKVLLLNGSPHANGCTAAALKEMISVFEAEGVETELVHVGNKDIRGCIACRSCMKNGKCVFDDLVNEVAPKFEAADGLVIGSPVYYASPNGTILSFVDRLFYSTRFSKHMKVGAAVVSARRGGNTASFDVLNKYFSISGMPIATAISPMNTVEDGNGPITFRWSLSNAYGNDPSLVNLWWKLPSEGNQNWHVIVSSSTPITEYTTPAGYFPAGEIQWLVHAYNQDNVRGRK